MLQSSNVVFGRAGLVRTVPAPAAALPQPAPEATPAAARQGFVRPVLAVLGLHLGAGVIAAILVVTAKAIASGGIGEFEPSVLYGIVLLQQVLTLVLLPWLAGRGGQSRITALALGPIVDRGKARTAIGLTALAMLTLAGLILVAVKTAGLPAGGAIGSIGDIARLDPVARLVFLPTALIAAPLVEELLVRGYLFGRLAQSRIGYRGALLVSSLVFAAMHLHLGVPGMVFMMGLGTVLGIVRLRSGSIRPAIALHGLWNGLILGVAMLAV